MDQLQMEDCDGEKNEVDKKNERGNWANQMDYLMSVIGSIVGYGNLWRFPYLCNRNGGGAFLIPFLFFLITCGLPLFFLEISIGQFTGKSNIHIWSVCPLLKGVGIGQFIVCSVCLIYYQNILAWSVYYLGVSCSEVLPWTTCNNDWNTKYCVDAGSVVSANQTNASTTYNGTVAQSQVASNWSAFTLAHTDVEEYWQYKALGVSEGVHQIGRVQWHLALSLFVSWLLVFLCLVKGVRSIGKVWLEALLQVFYSLGPGWGFVIALSSYNKFNDNTLRNSLIVTFAGEGTSLFSGLVIFTVLGFMANRAGVGVSEVASSGPGLGFVAYPEGLSELPLPQLWAFLFFVMLLTIGLDSQFTWVETLVTILLDQFPRQLRKRRLLVTAILCMSWFLMGLPYTTQGGIYYFQLVDWYNGCISLILFGVIEAITFTWIYGANNFGRDVELMLGRKVPLFFNVLLGYITPSFLIIALFLVLWQFQPPTYGKYEYPFSCRIVGWMLAMLSVIPVPIMAVVALCKAKGSFLERLKEATRPDKSWKPAEAKYHRMYRTQEESTERLSCLKPCTQ